MKTISVHGIPLQFERRKFYCGHGPVRPIIKSGWVVLYDGQVIDGNDTRWFSMMSDKKVPQYPTLAEAVAYEDRAHVERTIAHAIKKEAPL